MSDVKKFVSASQRAKQDGSEKAPIFFEVDEDRFEAAGVAPGKFLLDTAAAAVDGRQIQSAKALSDFIESCLVEPSKSRWIQRTTSAVEPIGVADISEIASWLLQQYTGRPTQPPSSSDNGRSTTGTSSTADASPQGSTL